MKLCHDPAALYLQYDPKQKDETMFTLKLFGDKNTAYYFEAKDFQWKWLPEQKRYRIRANLALGGSSDFFVVGDSEIPTEKEFQVCYVLNENGKQVDRIGSGARIFFTGKPLKGVEIPPVKLGTSDNTSPDQTRAQYQKPPGASNSRTGMNPRDAAILGGDPSL